MSVFLILCMIFVIELLIIPIMYGFSYFKEVVIKE